MAIFLFFVGIIAIFNDPSSGWGWGMAIFALLAIGGLMKK